MVYGMTFPGGNCISCNLVISYKPSSYSFTIYFLVIWIFSGSSYPHLESSPLDLVNATGKIDPAAALSIS